MNALRPRSRPDYGTACVTSRHHRWCRSGTVAGGLSAAASRRKACRPPSSLRKLVAVSVWQTRRRFQIPGVAAAINPAGRPATGHCHGLTLAALLRSHTGRPRLAARVFREDNPQRPCGSRRRPVRSPPLLCRSGICVGQRTGRRVAGSLRAGCARRRIPVPSVAAAVNSAGRPATRAGAGGGSRSAGARSLRVDTRPSPHARRPAACRHSAPAQ